MHESILLLASRPQILPGSKRGSSLTPLRCTSLFSGQSGASGVLVNDDAVLFTFSPFTQQQVQSLALLALRCSAESLLRPHVLVLSSCILMWHSSCSFDRTWELMGRFREENNPACMLSLRTLSWGVLNILNGHETGTVCLSSVRTQDDFAYGLAYEAYKAGAATQPAIASFPVCHPRHIHTNSYMQNLRYLVFRKKNSCLREQVESMSLSLCQVWINYPTAFV